MHENIVLSQNCTLLVYLLCCSVLSLWNICLGSILKKHRLIFIFQLDKTILQRDDEARWATGYERAGDDRTGCRPCCALGKVQVAERVWKKKNPHPGAAKLVNPCPWTVEGCGRADLHSKSKGHDGFPSKQEMWLDLLPLLERTKIRLAENGCH